MNPVAELLTNSPTINAVPSVKNPLIALPTTLVTVNLVPDVCPPIELPISGKIPLILVNVSSDISISSIVTFTYLTLAGGCGG